MSNTKKALKAEAAASLTPGFEPKTAEIEYEGVKYTVSNEGLIDSDFVEAYETDKTISAMKFLVGEENYAKFKAAGVNGKRNVFEITGFMNAVMGSLTGVDLGESTD